MNTLAVSQRNNSLSLNEVLTLLFNGRTPTLEDELLSACLFLSDACRFHDVAFPDIGSSSAPLLFDSKLQNVMTKIAKERGLSQKQISWCSSMVDSRIPWTNILGTIDAAFDPCFVSWLLDILNSFSMMEHGEPIDRLNFALSSFYSKVKADRALLPPHFLPTAVFLLEGATEMVLLPHVAHCLGVPFNAFGMMVVGAGGANQVVRQYTRLSRSTSLPLFCLLDADAVDQAAAIRRNLRQDDRLFVISQGEVEDTLDTKLFVDLLNEYMHSSLASVSSIEPTDLQSGVGKVYAAERLLRERASMEFDKVKFARTAITQIKRQEEIPEELRYIVMSIADDLLRFSKHGQ
jgi:hypothetical protein